MRARQGAKLARSKLAPIQGRIDRLDGLTLVGHVTSPGLAPPAILLSMNGRAATTSAICTPRSDYMEDLPAGMRAVDFTIEIPVEVWTVDASLVRFEILADGKPLATPFELHRASLLRALETLLSGSLEDREGQYRSLLALEHIKHGGLLNSLTSAVRQRAFAVAKQFGLLADLGDNNEIPEEQDGSGAGRDPNQVIVDQALRLLSDRLADESQTCFFHVKSVLREKGFSGDLAKWFLASTIPLLCHHDELLSLSEITDFADLQFFKEGDWELSMTVAVTMAQGEIERARTALEKLAGIAVTDFCWINLECIHFALRQLSRLLAASLATQQDVENFHYSVMNFVKSIGSDWFSRLYDDELAAAVALIVQESGRGRQDYIDDMTAGAIRHYGLCPVFWSKLDEGTTFTAATDLQMARKLFSDLQSYVERGPEEIAKNIGAITEILLWFQQRGNPDVQVVLRDISAVLLQSGGAVGAERPGQLITCLASRGRPERLRLAAFPFAKFCEAEGDVLHPVTYDLREAIRQSCPHPESAQSAACMALFREARKLAVTRDDSGFDRILYFFSGLVGLPEEWAGLDGLTVALCHARDRDAAASRLTTTIVNALERLVNTPEIAHVPAPALAAIERLERAGHLTSALPRFHKQLRTEKESIPAKTRDKKRSGPSGDVFADTLVVIYSCEANLGTRVAAIRQTWIEDLKKWNIPYLIAVGNGDDQVKGDVIHLGVSDDYEDLPKKTLALLRFVLTKPGVKYLVKVDDDCYLNVEEFFGSARYRRHHYFGRRIERPLGGTERTWHQSKSRSESAKHAFDKSPEPSVYADGGSGYSLSRYAMRQIMAVLAGATGKSLAARSFLEDKLIGDLLSLVGIDCQSQGYLSFQRRSPNAGGIPVGMWENTFYPSVASGVDFAHLDIGSQREAHRVRSTNALLPKKIWPTHVPAMMLPDSNQLELVTPVKKTAELVTRPIAVISVVRNEETILPHFLDHYRALGIQCFCFVDNLSQDGTREFLLAQPDVILYSADTQYRYSHFGVAWQQAVLANHFLGKWVIAADADELLVYRGWRSVSVADLCEKMAAEGADAGKVILVDMYPEGDLREADFAGQAPFEAAPWHDRLPVTPWRLNGGNFTNDTAVTSSLRHRLDVSAPAHAYTAQKFALFRYFPWVRLAEGLHDATNVRVSARPLWFAHFKYHSGFAAKALEEVRRRQHFNDAAEYRRYRELLSEGLATFRYEGSVKFDPSDDSGFSDEGRLWTRRTANRKVTPKQPLVAAGRFYAPGLSVPSNAVARGVRLEENFVADGYTHLDLSANNVMIEEETWPRVRLKFARSAGDFSVEFREQDDWPTMFEEFPSTGRDQLGPFLVLSLWEPFNVKNRRDRLLVEAAVGLLPAWVDKIVSQDQFTPGEAEAWREAAREFSEKYREVLTSPGGRANPKRAVAARSRGRRAKVKR